MIFFRFGTELFSVDNMESLQKWVFLDGRRDIWGGWGGGTSSLSRLPVQVDEVSSDSIGSVVKEGEHSSRYLSVVPILEIGIFDSAELGQLSAEGSEVEKGGRRSEPKLQLGPIDICSFEVCVEEKMVETKECCTQEAESDH